MGKLLTILAALLLVPVARADDNAANLLSAGNADQAIAALQSELKTSPNNTGALNLLCRAFYALGKWDRSISAGERAVAADPNNSMYHLWLGRAYGEKADDSSIFSAPGWAKKAHAEFETAVRLDPKNVAARTDLSEFFIEAPGIMGGGTDKAEAQARILEKLSPAKAHWIRARIAQKNKDWAGAEKEFRAAIPASNSPGSAWLDLGGFFRRTNRLEDMEKAVSQAVGAAKEEPEVLVDAAALLIRAGRDFPLATQLLRRYLDSPSKVEEAPAFHAQYLLGTVLEKQGNKQGAAEAYSAALALAKEYSPALEGLKRVKG
ncbi:MAG TPA: tetratricopeptide repeat protein [Terriglobales bacterium]|jgi:tetratricopeptide (TPR) repeat protein